MRIIQAIKQNIRKDRVDMFKAGYTVLRFHLDGILTEEQRITHHLYLAGNKGLMEITEIMYLTDYQIVKDELQSIELEITH